MDQPASSASPETAESPPRIFCFACGESIDARAEICPKCGVRQRPVAPPPSPLGATTTNGKNKVVAALLALFLGTIGIHKFYLGQTAQGVIYIVGSITIVGLLVTVPLSIIEGIRYLVMSDHDFAMRYGSERPGGPIPISNCGRCGRPQSPAWSKCEHCKASYAEFPPVPTGRFMT